MPNDSPAVILYDGSGNPLAIQNGVATPANTSALMVAGSDGTNSRYMKVDSSGRPVVVGAGTTGTPSGGVVSVQGPGVGTVGAFIAVCGSSGYGAPVSTTVSGGSISISGPVQTALGPSGYTYPRAFDLDTGAGTENVAGASLRFSASGGSVEAGTASNPLRTDPTGTTTQPVSATALPLPSGAATETTLGGVLTTTAFQARINTQGQKAMSASTPVVVASDQSAIPVTPARSSTATLSNVAADTSSQTLLAANANRLGAIIVNDSPAKLYVKFGTTASDTSFTAKMFSGDTYEIPFGYTGRIDGVWSVVVGNARITELT